MNRRWDALIIPSGAFVLSMVGLGLKMFGASKALMALYWLSLIIMLVVALWVAHLMHGARRKAEREQSEHDYGDDWTGPE